MSTPIEIVRAHVQWRIKATEGFDQIPTPLKELTAALAAVLADAERYKALERAFEKHGNEGMVTVMRWKGQRVWHYTKEPEIDGSTLAELADRLREVKP